MMRKMMRKNIERIFCNDVEELANEGRGGGRMWAIDIPISISSLSVSVAIKEEL